MEWLCYRERPLISCSVYQIITNHSSKAGEKKATLQCHEERQHYAEACGKTTPTCPDDVDGGGSTAASCMHCHQVDELVVALAPHGFANEVDTLEGVKEAIKLSTGGQIGLAATIWGAAACGDQGRPRGQHERSIWSSS